MRLIFNERLEKIVSIIMIIEGLKTREDVFWHCIRIRPKNFYLKKNKIPKTLEEVEDNLSVYLGEGSIDFAMINSIEYVYKKEVKKLM